MSILWVRPVEIDEPPDAKGEWVICKETDFGARAVVFSDIPKPERKINAKVRKIENDVIRSCKETDIALVKVDNNPRNRGMTPYLALALQLSKLGWSKDE